MDGVFIYDKVKNNDDSEISYCNDEIGYYISEIRNSGEMCVWI